MKTKSAKSIAHLRVGTMLTTVILFVLLTILVMDYVYKAQIISPLKTEVSALNVCTETLSNEANTLSATVSNQDIQIINLEESLRLVTADKEFYQAHYDSIMHIEDSDSPYYQATLVWNYLKAIGLNDYVASGIIGNIMTEVGGQTLDFRRHSTTDSGNGFGLCQWNGGRKERLLSKFGSSIYDQCRFLGVELYETFAHDSPFYSLQSAEEAALWFAKYYERCAEEYYLVRAKNALIAYEFFVR